MKYYREDELFNIMEYLAFCGRCSIFKDDFINSVTGYLMLEHNYDYADAIYSGVTLYASVLKRGVVETFQEFIGSDDYCKALIHAYFVEE